MSENKGNIYMLKKKLESNNLDEKKNAMKMIISAMTCGEDVSPLFAPIIRNMEEDNLELKKLIYLYVINYAKTHPDLIILAINSFIKDAREHKNPILRALAIRTMGCIRVSQITEYLMEPLREALKDEDSYVRKTGVICVIKMYDSNPDLIESLGFLEMLNNLLTDGNAMVVSNTVAALGQISEKKGVNLLIINDFLANRLISALPEATEWGQTYILDALAGHVPSTSQICEE